MTKNPDLYLLGIPLLSPDTHMQAPSKTKQGFLEQFENHQKIQLLKFSTKNDDDIDYRWFSELLGYTYHWAMCFPCIISFTSQNDDTLILNTEETETQT